MSVKIWSLTCNAYLCIFVHLSAISPVESITLFSYNSTIIICFIWTLHQDESMICHRFKTSSSDCKEGNYLFIWPFLTVYESCFSHLMALLLLTITQRIQAAAFRTASSIATRMCGNRSHVAFVFVTLARSCVTKSSVRSWKTVPNPRSHLGSAARSVLLTSLPPPVVIYLFLTSINKLHLYSYFGIFLKAPYCKYDSW